MNILTVAGLIAAGIVVFIILVSVLVKADQYRLSPEDRQKWLHMAATVALTVEHDVSNAVAHLDPGIEETLAGHMNTFLKLHKIPIHVTKDEILYILTSLNLVTPSK